MQCAISSTCNLHISFYFGTYNIRQTQMSLHKCAFSIQHALTMSIIKLGSQCQASPFLCNEFYVSRLKPQCGKRPFCRNKQTYLANLKPYQDSVVIWFNNICCNLQMFNFDGQEDLTRQRMT